MIMRGVEMRLLVDARRRMFLALWSLLTALVNGTLIVAISRDMKNVPFYAVGWMAGTVLASYIPVGKCKNSG